MQALFQGKMIDWREIPALNRSMKFHVKNSELDDQLYNLLVDTISLSSRAVAAVLNESGIQVTHATVCSWRNAMFIAVHS